MDIVDSFRNKGGIKNPSWHITEKANHDVIKVTLDYNNSPAKNSIFRTILCLN